ncbi:serine/threonine protein kinase [Trichormus variabilis ARAD]|uniref:serine/threonine-protein kinase n=1 Tax=Anabaena variabilis TaxID=264691 RepID=UPI001624C80F|nr:serine/threonine-protein kinase [Trichormus variabilis]MBC1215898.1 serine/threonine protein kinase [Trichormus variabilis ARAD]MBC1327914.1 serine/threonine protein kinase [Trichormus variabilis 9RC]
MNRFSGNITNLHQYNLQQNQLAQMCGSKELFCDRYQILRILGRGGFGVTFLAGDAVLPGNPLCVIKQLCPKVTSAKSWQNACQRFQKEAKTLAKLGSHSQIPMLLNYFEGDGELYLVQEYVRGYTLSQEVRHHGIKTEAEVKRFLLELLPILQYLYQNQVIHRDIKPQNIVRCADDGRIVLIDFGAVKEKLSDVGLSSFSQNAHTNFVGTTGFAPPEQFSLRPVYASDIYALGMTCIYLLTGKAPLEMENNSKTGEICWHKYVKVSDDFAKIIRKMVKFSLDERFQKPQDVIEALNKERDLPNFSDCLTSQPLSNKRQTKVETSEKYVPSVTRTAMAIREWKAKLQQKQLQRSLQHFSSV